MMLDGMVVSAGFDGTGVVGVVGVVGSGVG